MPCPMTRCGILRALLAAALAAGGVGGVGVVGCSRAGCAPAPPIVRSPPPPAPPPPVVEDYEIAVRDAGDRLVFVVRAASGGALGEWTMGTHPTAAQLAPVARAVPASGPGARRVTVRATDGVMYAVIVALLDACHENGVSDVLVGPPLSP